MSKKVAIVVLNWNGAKDTLACLESLQKQLYRNFVVLVVDNGSTDDSLANLRGYLASYPVELLETGRNLGYAGGNNVGIRYALQSGAELVLVLNNDTVVASDLLVRLVEATEKYPDSGMFSPRVMYMDAPDTVWDDGSKWNAAKLAMESHGRGRREPELDSADHESDSACGAALFVRAELARQIGLLEESFFLVWEEVDWSFRARFAGWKIMVIPKAKVWHSIGVSFCSEASPLRRYFSVRNELHWFRRHASALSRARLWMNTIRRLVPRFCINTDRRERLRKRLIWALIDYGGTWIGKGGRLEYLAMRRGVSDYLHGRLGDCPEEVRNWNREWAERQKGTVGQCTLGRTGTHS